MIQFKICQNGFQVVDENGEDIKMRDGGYGDFGKYLDAVAEKYPKYEGYIQENREALIKTAQYVTHLVKEIKEGRAPKELENKLIKI